MRLVSCFAGCFGILALVGCSSSLQPAGQGGSGGSRTTSGAGGAPATGGISGTSGTNGSASISCGKTLCVSGEFCCDPLCSVCAPIGSLCDLGCSVDAGALGTCASLAVEYDRAVMAARACTPGTTCAAMVHATLASSVCGCDFVFVNDATQPDAIYQKWVGLGCQPISLCGGTSCGQPAPGWSCFSSFDGGPGGLCQPFLPGTG